MQNQEGPTGGTTVPTALQPSSKVPVISLNSQHVQKGDPSPTVVPQPYSSYLRQPEVLPGSAEEENMMGPGQGGGLVAPGGRLDGGGVLQSQHSISCQPTLSCSAVSISNLE